MKFCSNGKFFTSSHQAGVNCSVDETQFAKSVFETLRTYQGSVIFAKEEHLDRLWKSAELLSIALPPLKKSPKETKQFISDSLDVCVKHNHLEKSDLRIKVLVRSTHFWITTEKLVPLSKEEYEKGVVVVDKTFDRPFAYAKYTTPVYKKVIESQGDAFETIFFDTAGFLREGNISNVFAVFGDTVITPERNILHGVTREKVLSLPLWQRGNEGDLQVETREIHRDELLTADEIFLTNTTKEIIPVREWRNWRGTSFEVAKKLRKEFHRQFIISKK
ncbi:aminotransferase class IV [Candidatus Gracilibacteria bacterium]|nr:aminotransferase class IV [Candidatus Gracilibacteria bacterium]